MCHNFLFADRWIDIFFPLNATFSSLACCCGEKNNIFIIIYSNNNNVILVFGMRI